MLVVIVVFGSSFVSFVLVCVSEVFVGMLSWIIVMFSLFNCVCLSMGKLVCLVVVILVLFVFISSSLFLCVGWFLWFILMLLWLWWISVVRCDRCVLVSWVVCLVRVLMLFFSGLSV